MEVLNQTKFKVAPFAGRMNFPDHSLTIIVKGTFDLTPGGVVKPSEEQLYPAGDEYYPDDDEQAGSLRYESDFVFYKPNTDLLLVGNCYTPGGQPATACQVTFQVGRKSRSLTIFGDRYWEAIAPQSFTQMDLRYENSFGGAAYKKNPIGKGVHDEEKKQKINPLPNIEDLKEQITSKKSRPEPAGFGPLGRMLEYRHKKMGTYTGNYVKTRWPWFPEDFDWTHFNIAPPQMQVDGYLKGDETLFFENLHPEHSCYKSALPGLRAHCFINAHTKPDTDENEFREVTMNLDTLWVDMEAQKLVLIWRGWTEILTDEFEEVEHIFVVAESVNEQPKSLDHYNTLFNQAKAEEEAKWTPVMEEPEPDEKEILMEEEAEEPAETEDEKDEPIDKEIENIQKKLKEDLKKAGIDLDNPKTSTKDALIKAGIDPDNPAPLSDSIKKEQFGILTKMGLSEEQIAKIQAVPKWWDPKELAEALKDTDKEKKEETKTTPLTRELVKKRIAEGDGFSGEDLSGLDLSGLEMNGIDLTNANLTNANLSGTNLGSAILSKAQLSGTIMDGATLSGADMSLSEMPGIKLSKIDLSSVNLTEANLVGADLSETNLTAANLTKANLSEANLKQAVLKNADLTEANLKKTILSGAMANGAIFEKANLEKAHLDDLTALDAYFTKASLTNTDFRGSMLSGSDFTNSILHHADFTEANLCEANMRGAQGEKINMTKADLTKLRASFNTNFSGGTFIRISGKESLWEQANLTETDFSYAYLEGATFKSALMYKANLYAANMKFARFLKADLKEAYLSEVNLFQGSFEKADLKEANLTKSNLYEVEFLDARIEKTNFSGANVKMTKLAGSV